MATWPFSTRVKRSRISAVGSPTATVRVTSVVPSSYCAPESIRNNSPDLMARFVLRGIGLEDRAIEAHLDPAALRPPQAEPAAPSAAAE